MPVTKTIWYGKVGTHDFGAFHAIIPMTRMPITSIYCTVNTRYGHTLGTPKICACNMVLSETRKSRYRHTCQGPKAAVPITRETQNFALRNRELLAPSKLTRVKHRYNKYTRKCHRTNEHIDTCLPLV